MVNFIQVFGSKYELLEKLAQGGMAEVFLARVTTGRAAHTRIAIKRILPQLTAQQEFIEMFLQEARLGALLSHKNIVQIHDRGRIGEYYFLAMEFVEGRTLRDLLVQTIRTRKTASYATVARIAADIAAGLHYAHTAKDGDVPLKLVHRDISPSNIIISFRGDVKITDFGLAKASQAIHQTAVGVVKGKCAYMSPEQVAGERVDRRSDIFSLGVVLYELTTLTRLFVRENTQEAMDAIMLEPIPPPSSFVPDYPKILDRIVMHCLERDANDRYQDAATLQRDLERYLKDSKKDVSPAAVAAMLRRAFADSAQGNLPRIEAPAEQTGHSVLTHSALARRREMFYKQSKRPGSRIRSTEAIVLLALFVAFSLVSWIAAYFVFR